MNEDENMDRREEEILDEEETMEREPGSSEDIPDEDSSPEEDLSDEEEPELDENDPLLKKPSERKISTGEEHVERADRGLDVVFSHGGRQKLDELLKDIEERGEEEQEELFLDTGFDEEAEREKQEKILERDRIRRQQERDYYWRQDAYYRKEAREEEERRQSTKGIEAREEEDAYTERVLGDYPGYRGVPHEKAKKDAPGPAEEADSLPLPNIKDLKPSNVIRFPEDGAGHGNTVNISRSTPGRGIIVNGAAAYTKGIVRKEKEDDRTNVGGRTIKGITNPIEKLALTGKLQWENAFEKKKRKNAEKMRSASSGGVYRRFRSGVIFMGREEQEEDEEDETAPADLKKRGPATKEAMPGRAVSTKDLRGAGKMQTGTSLNRAGAGTLARQSAAARAGASSIYRFRAKNGMGLTGDGSEDSATGSVVTEKIKKALVAAAKKAVIGFSALSIGAGAIAGAGAYNRSMQGNSTDAYYYPIQANTPVSEEGSKTMTQEVMDGMVTRMKAYGVPLTMNGAGAYGQGAIRIHVPGYPNGPVSGETNWGDTQIIMDGSGKCLVIDGGYGPLSDMLIQYLQTQGITSIDMLCTHWHHDHCYGLIRILDSTSIHINHLYCHPPEETAGLDGKRGMEGYDLIRKVRARGGEVVYVAPDRLTSMTLGDLNMVLWRTGSLSPGAWDNGDRCNNASIQVYFQDLYYLTTGDIYTQLPEFLDLVSSSTIKFFKMPHHGNGSANAMLKLKNMGAEFFWENNVESTSWEVGTNTALALGLQIMETNSDLDFIAENGVMTATGDGKTFTYSIPYTGGGTAGMSGPLMQQVCEYAKSWVGKVPYKSSVTGNDPNGERFMPLAEGRGSDCSWFVYHVMEHFGLVPDDFIHSYEWGNNPEKYPEFHNVGTDMSSAMPGDVLCTGAGTQSSNSHVAIYIGDGKQVECAAGYGTILSDAPGSVRQIVRYSGAGTTALMGGTTPAGQETRYGFSQQTESIVEAHMNDFDYHNYDQYMAGCGGVKNYIRSLGGVFAKWVDRKGSVKTAGEFQEVAEYIMGLYTIWGADYKGGGPTTAFNEDADREYGRFYKGMSAGPFGFDDSAPIEEIFADKRNIITDCGSGIEQLLYKAGLCTALEYPGKDNPSAGMSYIERYGGAAMGGKIITNKRDLQVGDLVQMSKSDGWHHVCVVGEVWQDGTVITYDTGNRYVRTGNYKKKFETEADGKTFIGDYGGAGYIDWFGMRVRTLDQTGGMSSGMATQNLAKIKVNSVRVDGERISNDEVDMKNLGGFTWDGNPTRSVKVNWKFVDRNGSVLGESSGFGQGGMGSSGIAVGGSAGKILEIAESHMGSPYVYGGDSWTSGIDCSHFVTRVLKEAGVYDGGYMTSYGWATYGREVDDIEHAQAGDIVISNGGGHVSIYDGVRYVYEAKGSQWGCVHDRLPGNIVTIRRILPDGQQAMTAAAGSGSGSGAGVNSTPSGQGPEIAIPDGLGTSYTYMGWQKITSTSSRQYKLRDQSGMNFDSEGFGVIGNRYVIACAQTFGNVGDYVDFYNSNGLIFHCVIGDIKSSGDAGYSKWGHHDGRNVIEFIVDEDSWYGQKDNPGTSSNHPEWKGSISKAVNLGSYFDNPGMATMGGTGTAGSNYGLNMAAMTLMKQVLSMSSLGSYYDDPVKMAKYGKYCYDLIDFAICESGGADIEFTTFNDSYMECSATVTVVCSLPLLEENDKNFTSWELKFEDGDMMPSNYMSLSKKDFELIFNVDTTVRDMSLLSGDPGFEGTERDVYLYFKNKGYGPAQISGIMANIKLESGFRADAVNESSGASGLFQWLGGRLRKLKSDAARKGLDWTNVTAQLDYAYEEIHGGSGWAGNTSAKQKFESTNDPYEAGALMSKYFERHGLDTEHAVRGKLAKEYYEKMVIAGGSQAYVQWAVNIANNDSYGYCQHHRNGNPDYDCSSLVYYALKNSGYPVGSDGAAFTTYSMDGPLTKCGFRKIHINSYTELQPGDILWKPTHTEIYVGNGRKVGAHTNEIYSAASEAPQHGDQTGDEISCKDVDDGWEWVYRK